MSAGSRKIPPPMVMLTMLAARATVPSERTRDDSEAVRAGSVTVAAHYHNISEPPVAHLVAGARPDRQHRRRRPILVLRQRLVALAARELDHTPEPLEGLAA